MANEQMRPASNDKAPDPSNTYERAHPENEAGQGRLSSDKPVPSHCPDSMEASVTQKQDGTHQLNAEDVIDQRSKLHPSDKTAAQPPDNSKKS
jgi:hypothetical protein